MPPPTRQRQEEESNLEVANAEIDPRIPRAYRPGIYGVPSANPTRWAPVYNYPMQPFGAYSNSYPGALGAYAIQQQAAFGTVSYRPLPYEAPRKLHDNNYSRLWVKVPGPAPGTRVFLQDAPVMGTDFNTIVHIDGSVPPRGYKLAGQMDTSPMGYQSSHDLQPGPVNAQSYLPTGGAARTPGEYSHERMVESDSVPLHVTMPDGRVYGYDPQSGHYRPHVYIGDAHIGRVPSVRDDVYAHHFGSAPSSQPALAGFGHSLPEGDHTPLDANIWPSSTDDPMSGAKSTSRHGMDGCATTSGSISAPPQDFNLPTTVARPPTADATRLPIYTAPRSTTRLGVPFLVPGGSNYVPVEDLTFPPSSEKQIKEAQKERRKRTRPRLAVSPEMVRIPMNPKVVVSGPQLTRISDLRFSESASSQGSGPSSVYQDALPDFTTPAYQPPDDDHSPNALSPFRVEDAEVGALGEQLDTASLVVRLSLDAGNAPFVANEAKYPRIRGLFRSMKKGTVQQPDSTQLDVAATILSRDRKPSLQVAPGTVIINTMNGSRDVVRPQIQQSIELMDTVRAQETEAVPTAPTPALRRGAISYVESPILSGRILREDVPLPKAVESLRPRVRPGQTDTGGPYSEPYNGRIPAQRVAFGAELEDSPQSFDPHGGQSATIEQPWASMIALPAASKAESFNPIRELNRLHYNPEQPAVRVMAIPQHVQIPGSGDPENPNTGGAGTAVGPPLRVMQVPDELNMEYFEQHLLKGRDDGAGERKRWGRIILRVFFASCMIPMPLLVFKLVIARCLTDDLSKA